MSGLPDAYRAACSVRRASCAVAPDFAERSFSKDCRASGVSSRATTHGARSTRHGAPGVVLLLSREFTKLVLIACVVAFPIAYIAMRSWLQGFAYAADIGWLMFVAAGAAALIIAWITVGYQSIKAAVSDPVRSLRYE